MKIYNRAYLGRLLAYGVGNRVPYEPFDRKYPTRLYIEVSFVVLDSDRRRGRKVRRFFYNGTYNPGAIVRAKRIKAILQKANLLPSVDLIEYHRKGVLAYGTFEAGQTLFGHHYAHPFSSHDTRETRMRYGSFEPEVIVSLGKERVMVPSNRLPKSDDKQLWHDFRKELRVRRNTFEVR